MRGRIAGKAGHLVAPGRDFAGLLCLQVPDERWDVRKIASDLAGIFRERGDHDALVVDDPHQAARGQISRPDRVLELGDQGADEEDGLNFSGGVPDRPRDREHPFLIPSILHWIADRDRLSGKGLLEIIAVADVVAGARGRSDVLANGPDDGDIRYERRQLGFQSRQQRVVCRRIGRLHADYVAQPEAKIFDIAEMVVDLRSGDTRLAVGAVERLGLRYTVLDRPQRDPDQDQKRNRGCRHEPE